MKLSRSSTVATILFLVCSCASSPPSATSEAAHPNAAMTAPTSAESSVEPTPALGTAESPVGPPSAASAESKPEASTLGVTITSSGEIIFGDKPVPNDAAFLAEAKGFAMRHPDMPAVVIADSTVKQATAMHVIDLLKQAGISKVSLRSPPSAK